MSALRNLALGVGALAIGAVVLTSVRDGADATSVRTRQRDGGAIPCTPADMVCDVRLPEDISARLADAGRSNGKRYQRVAMDIRQCGDAGYILTDRRLTRADGGILPGLTILEETCSISADAGVPNDATLRTIQPPCACRAAAGLCQFRQADGGLQQLPFGNTGSPPSLVVGPGCVRKSCRALTGKADDSWPAACPTQ